MKNSNTIRTLKRAGIKPASIGFAGHTPTGKAVRRLAKMRRATTRLVSQLPAHMLSEIFRTDVRERDGIKAATRYLRSQASVKKALSNV